MSTDSPKKPSFPPLKCEQLEDRLVLTVSVTTAGTQPTEPVHSHSTQAGPSNIVLHPTIQANTIIGTTTTTIGGSELSTTSAATSATAGTSGGVSSSSGTSAQVSAPAAGSYSSAAYKGSVGAFAGGGPLFASGSVPSITFAASSSTIPIPNSNPSSNVADLDPPGGNGSTTPSLPASANGTISAALENQIPQPTLTSQTHPVANETTLTEYLAPTPTAVTTTNTSSTATQLTDEMITSLPASTPPALTATSISTVTSSDTNVATTIVINSNSTQRGDDQLINPDTDVPQM